MNTTSMKRVLVAATLASATALASVAQADEPNPADAAQPPPAAATAPSSRNPLSMALLAGHGFKDAFRTGFGARLGYTLPSNIYLGGAFVYHVGTTEGPVQANASYGGGELGYDFIAGPAILRAYSGFGVVSANATVTIPPVGTNGAEKMKASESRFGIWPGASLVFPFENGSAFVGVDAKLLIVENATAFNTYGTFGLAL
ncbi:MAG: hypothetical protein HYV09_40675 [Deltaproteobacteria bacterium]|nr:hypothetical protein [Deltaproteobacteria bacterium]